MRNILLFLCLSFQYCCAQQWQWPVQDFDDQHRVVGFPGEDRGSSPNTRARHHRGLDISYRCPVPSPEHIHWDVYSIEAGDVYYNASVNQACMGHYHYTHLVKDPFTIDGNHYDEGHKIGRMQSSAFHLHLQMASAEFEEFILYDSDDPDWINPLSVITPFEDNKEPVIDDFLLLKTVMMT